MYQDTIAAISTPVGAGGIGIVRISGPRSSGILGHLFRRPGGQALATFPPRQLLLGYIVDPATGEQVDEVLVAYMPAPHSYTREDVGEINCHGGPVAVQRVLGLALAAGARLAGPGEFTLRAFLNGRLDLSQAEAVMDIVQARTAAGLRLAEAQLGGGLSAEVKQVRRPLVSVLAYLTALVDFPEDEIPDQEFLGPVQTAFCRVQKLAESAETGAIYRQGVRTAIVGRPNVGKSSLLNALLRQARAIVTPVPGTTRDTVEETLNLRGIPVVLVDTAGITCSENIVEQLGIERSRQALSRADLVLMVVDASQPLQEGDREIASQVEVPAVLVANKNDLPAAITAADLVQLLPGAKVVHTSMQTGAGLMELEVAIERAILGNRVYASDALLVTNPRHQEALHRAAGHLKDAIEGLERRLPADLLVVHLEAALNALGEITGETVSDELLEAIFSQFCVGK